jgi:hypothetical protein
MEITMSSASSINKFEYGYLKGDKVMWPGWGAAFGVVMEFCESRGYGGFGTPTERGLKAMEEYEQQTH